MDIFWGEGEDDSRKWKYWILLCGKTNKNRVL